MVETLQQLQLKKIIMKFPLSRGKKDTGLLKSSKTGCSESILWLWQFWWDPPPAHFLLKILKQCSGVLVMPGSDGTTLEHRGPSYVALQSGGLEQVASSHGVRVCFCFRILMCVETAFEIIWRVSQVFTCLGAVRPGLQSPVPWKNEQLCK